MKTINFILYVFIGFLLCSCSRNEEINVKELTDQAKIAKIQQSGIKGIPFPLDSKAVDTEVHDVIKISLPEDVFFVVKDSKGEVYRLPEAGVRCTCTQGTGCSPVKYDGDYYCVMNENCSVCSMKTTRIGSNEVIEIIGLMDERKPVKLFANVSGKFTTNVSKHQYGISEDFFKCKEVRNEIANLYKVIYGENIPDFIKNNSFNIPTNYTYTKVDFFGNEILVPIPKTSSIINDLNLKIVDPGDRGGVSCKCYKGSGCVLKSMLGTKYCDAENCSDCALNG